MGPPPQHKSQSDFPSPGHKYPSIILHSVQLLSGSIMKSYLVCKLHVLGVLQQQTQCGNLYIRGCSGRSTCACTVQEPPHTCKPFCKTHPLMPFDLRHLAFTAHQWAPAEHTEFQLQPRATGEGLHCGLLHRGWGLRGHSPSQIPRRTGERQVL